LVCYGLIHRVLLWVNEIKRLLQTVFCWVLITESHHGYPVVCRFSAIDLHFKGQRALIRKLKMEVLVLMLCFIWFANLRIPGIRRQEGAFLGSF